MADLTLVDTTLRDGHQCLWATRMTTPQLLPIVETMDRMGLQTIDFMGSVHFDACVRYLNENPWARIRAVRERVTATPLQAYIRSKCALSFELQPDDIANLWAERQIAAGIDRLIGFDGLHDIDNLEGALCHAKTLGATTGGWLIFSGSPVHTDEFYVAKAREFIDRCNVDFIVIQDTSGVLTADRAATLIPSVKAEIGDMSLGLHTHNLAGTGQTTYIAGVEAGVDHLYTSIAPIADGNAPPAMQTTVRNLRYLGHDIDIDDDCMAVAGRHFEAVSVGGGFPPGRPQDYDAGIFDHQIPGGVMSNFIAQLEVAGLADRLPEILIECGRVREELGWPIQVTPFSQFIEVQATYNIMSGERYGRVPDEVKQYALGYFGKANAPLDPDVMDRIVENGSPDIALTPPVPEPALPGLRKRFPHADEDELLLRHAFPDNLVNGLNEDLTSDQSYVDADKPLLFMLRQIAARPARSRIVVKKGDLALELSV
jgi:oxaloacetate decarboxylase alpha subunit